MAPGACRKARLRALCAGLFPPRAAGQLPAANVIFTTIYGKPYQTACTLDFPAEQAEYIQRVAQQTVLETSRC